MKEVTLDLTTLRECDGSKMDNIVTSNGRSHYLGVMVLHYGIFGDGSLLQVSHLEGVEHLPHQLVNGSITA